MKKRLLSLGLAVAMAASDVYKRQDCYREMIREGCEQEIAWGCYAIGDEVPGLTKQMITDYIRYLGNLRCSNLGFEPLYDGYAHEPETMAWVSQYSLSLIHI